MQYTNYDQIEWTKPKDPIYNTCHLHWEAEEIHLNAGYYENLRRFQEKYCYTCSNISCPYYQCKNQNAPDYGKDFFKTKMFKTLYQSDTDTLDCSECKHKENCKFSQENYVVHRCDDGTAENVPIIPGAVNSKYEQMENTRKREFERNVMKKLEQERLKDQEYYRKHPIKINPLPKQEEPNIIDIIVDMNSW